MSNLTLTTCSKFIKNVCYRLIESYQISATFYGFERNLNRFIIISKIISPDVKVIDC